MTNNDATASALASSDAAPESKPGWVLVPKELTEAMVDAYFDRCRELGFTSHITATTAWMALLAAAPQEPQP